MAEWENARNQNKNRRQKEKKMYKKEAKGLGRPETEEEV